MNPEEATPLGTRSQISIVHNHPIHYKHLLFKAMREQRMDFHVTRLADNQAPSGDLRRPR